MVPMCLDCVVLGVVAGSAGLVGVALGVWLLSRRGPRVIFRDQGTYYYVIKEDGSVEPVETLPPSPEKRGVVEGELGEEVGKVLEEVKHEVRQEVIGRWRGRVKRELLMFGVITFVIAFIVSYLYCSSYLKP